MPQEAFEDLLASTPTIQGCGNWDVETFWSAVIEAERRRTPLLWLQRSTRHARGEHLMVTFSKPTPVGGRASRKRRRTVRGEAMDAVQRQRALTSNRIVEGSSSSSSVRQTIQGHHNNERCMGSRQGCQWQCRGRDDEERRGKVHEFSGDSRDP